MSSTAVSVVGPGRVGTAVARALSVAGEDVVAVAGRGSAGLEGFASLVPGAERCSAEEAVRRGDLVVLAVPDDALVPLVRRLAAADAVAAGSRWLHVAGGHGLAALRPAALAGAGTAACHPAQTFPDGDPARLRGIAWAVTAAPADEPWARRLVDALGGRPIPVAEHARVRYHTAMTVGANGVSAVVALARDLLRGAGVDEPEALLEPVARAAAVNAALDGAAALTGPVRRGDAGTVARHLTDLEVDLPEALEAYRAISRLALGYARRAGLEATAAQRVAEVLVAAPGAGDGR